MENVEQIYVNDFGLSFYWRKEDEVLKDRVQIVFKETGFYLSLAEIIRFSEMIADACKKTDCGTCCNRSRCHKFLLKTPLREIDLAVSSGELVKIKDLIEGTLFHVQLIDYLSRLSLN